MSNDIKILTKIRYDGSHYLGQPYHNKTTIPTESIIKQDQDTLKLQKRKIDLFKSEYSGQINKKGNHPNPVYKEITEIYKNASKYCTTEETEELVSQYLECYFSYNNAKFILDKYKQAQYKNLLTRKQRFRNKAYNNDWNYFVTFTYNDKLHDENTFKACLKMTLHTLSTRYNWKYMGVFERSSTERLHFHGLVYVPCNKMIGELIEKEDYNFSLKKRKKVLINTTINDKIGRNTFDPINKDSFDFFIQLGYILKYIGKSNERIMYSRGLKDFEFRLFDFEDYMICKVNEASLSYVLFEDFLDSSEVVPTADLYKKNKG